jgi:glyoxylase-like metal-dependent hydrolase (beta-lactamase superfamily II)
MFFPPRPVKTGKIAEGIYAIRTGPVNFFIVKAMDGFLCFDAGFMRSLIQRELDRLRVDPARVTHLFLTHSDFDHAGGLPLFRKAEIYLSFNEEPMVTGRKARALGLFYNSPIKRPHHLLEDNEVVTAGSMRIRAIATPGHTPGSMSYLVDESTLFAGDAFKLVDGRVFHIRRIFTMDAERQKESIRKLARLDRVRLACTAHNGYTAEFREAIKAWI